MTLIAPALDLLALVQPGVIAANLGAPAAGVAAMLLLGMWVHYPRTSWLATQRRDPLYFHPRPRHDAVKACFLGGCSNTRFDVGVTG